MNIVETSNEIQELDDKIRELDNRLRITINGLSRRIGVVEEGRFCIACGVSDNDPRKRKIDK